MFPRNINDLSRGHHAIAEELLRAAERVLKSGWFVLGTEVAAFEREFADYCGAAHCVGLANGTDALELVLRALGVDAGDRVATVSNAGMYSGTAIRAIGAKPLYVDVRDDSMLLDPDRLAAAVRQTPCSAVIVTHLFGQLADMPRIEAVAREAGVPVIEDCAQAHGARLAGRKAGTFGIAGCFSFYPTKNLGALGDGGAVVTNDAGLAEKLRRLRQYGWTSKYRVEAAGGCNSRLDELQAAFLRVKLPHLDRWNARRREIASRYCARIRNPHVRLPAPPDESGVAHLFVVRCSQRDALAAHLKARSIPFDVHYPIPDHRQPAWAEEARLPGTDAACATVLTVPCFPDMTFEEVDAISAAVNEWAPVAARSVA